MGISPIAPLRKLSITTALAACALLAAIRTTAVHAQVGGGGCTVTGNTLDFGQLTFEELVAGNSRRTQAIILVSCPDGTSFQVGIDDGSNALTGQRRMKDLSTANFVSYELYQRRNGSDRFGDAVASERESGIGRGLRPVPITVFGELGAGQSVPAGLYVDSAVITVYF